MTELDRLKPYLRHLASCKKAWAEAVAGEGAGWPCTCGLADLVPFAVPLR